jgi:activating signal cointegrator complex subunit 3
VRHNEDVLNEEMAKGVRFALGGGAWDSPHVKTELLLQAHMLRAPLPIVDYATDTRSVMEQAVCVLALAFVLILASKYHFSYRFAL